MFEFGFGSLFMQADALNSVGALVASVSSIAITIGGIITAIAALMKAKSHDPKIDAIADKANAVGQIATAFGQKTAEHQKDAVIFADVLQNLNPEVKKQLQAHQRDIDYFTERANISNQQLQRLLAQIPKEASANAMENLPRESQKVLAVVNSTIPPATITRPEPTTE
jgi:gas vesicle protein